MALEALADVLSDLGKRYQNKVEDEQKRRDQLADIADQRAWLEGRTKNEQDFQVDRDKQHVADTKDLQSNESGLRIKEESERIKVQIEGHINEVIRLAPIQQANQLVQDHIVDNIEEAKTLTADTIRKLYIAKASEAATGELVNKIANQPLEFQAEDAKNAPALKYLEQAKDDANKNLKEIEDAAALAQLNSDASRVQDSLASDRMSKFQMTPALEKQIKSKAGKTRAQFEAMPAMDQLNILSDIPKSGIDAMSVMMLPSQADKIAKSNQANFAKLEQSIPGLRNNTQQLTLHVASLQPHPANNVNPTAPAVAPTPAFDVPNQGNTPVPPSGAASSFFAPQTGYQPGAESSGSNLILNTGPVSGANAPVSPVAMSPSAFTAPTEDAPVDNSAYFRGLSLPSAPVVSAPTPAGLAPAPVAAAAPAPAPLANNLVPSASRSTVVNYPTPSGDGKDNVRAQLAAAKAQLQSISLQPPGYDLNAKKAQLQNQIDGLNNLLNPAPSFFQMRGINNSIPAGTSYDAPNNLTMGGTA